jgi:hypothetical protein
MPHSAASCRKTLCACASAAFGTTVALRIASASPSPAKRPTPTPNSGWSRAVSAATRQYQSRCASDCVAWPALVRSSADVRPSSTSAPEPAIAVATTA